MGASKNKLWEYGVEGFCGGRRAAGNYQMVNSNYILFCVRPISVLVSEIDLDYDL